MNKKGVVYTIVSIVLLLVIAALFFTQTRRTGHELSSAVSDRVYSVNLFIKNLEVDSSRAAYIAGFRTMIAMEQHLTTTGTYFNDASAVFKEIFLTGNYSGDSFVIMKNSSFNEYLGRVHEDAGSQGISFNATVTELNLWQADPWNIHVNYTLSLNITDNRGTASWSTEREFMGVVPITDLRDPLFSVGTLARVQRVISRTNISTFVYDVGDANDTTGLLYHFNTSQYVAAGRGPNMLMRFEGNFSDNIFGFESLVDTEELTDQSLEINTTASVVDYKYFSGVDADACSIQNTPTRIKLDADDLNVYQVEGQLEYVAC